jgi:hypothetical protein
MNFNDLYTEWDLTGIPLPQYQSKLGIKGIDLYGDGKVYKPSGLDKESSKIANKSKHYTNLLSDDKFLTDKDKMIKVGHFAPDEVAMESYYDATYENLHMLKMMTVNSLKHYTPEGYELSLQGDDVVLYETPIDITNFFVEAKSDATTFAIRDTIYQTIQVSLSNKSNGDTINRIVKKFVNANSEKMAMNGPSSNISITSADVDAILRCMGLTRLDCLYAFKEALNRLKNLGNFAWIKSSIYLIGITSALVYAHSVQNEELIKSLITISGYAIYPLAFRKFFNIIDPKQSVMDAMIDGMSKKFLITRTSNLNNWVILNTKSAYNFHIKDLATNSDRGYIDYLNRLRNNFMLSMRKLRNEYDVYFKKNSTVRYAAIQTNAEGEVNVADNSMSGKASLQGDYISGLIIKDNINKQIVQSLSKTYHVNDDELISIMTELIKNPSMLYKTFIIEIISLYYAQNSATLNSKEFLSFVMGLSKPLVTKKQGIYKPISSIYKIWYESFGWGILDTRGKTNVIQSVLLYTAIQIQMKNK